MSRARFALSQLLPNVDALRCVQDLLSATLLGFELVLVRLPARAFERFAGECHYQLGRCEGLHNIICIEPHAEFGCLRGRWNIVWAGGSSKRIQRNVCTDRFLQEWPMGVLVGALPTRVLVLDALKLCSACAREVHW